MYMLTSDHRTTTYSDPTIAATAIAFADRGDISLPRFIDILKNMAEGEMFIGANFVVQCFEKADEEEDVL